jgi:hypothetical protein
MARGSELRRELDHVRRQARRQIYHRPQRTIKERSRLTHILDVNDNLPPIIDVNKTRPLLSMRNSSDNRKRRAYGCLLAEFKLPMNRTQQYDLHGKHHSGLITTEYSTIPMPTKKNNNDRTAMDQRDRMKTILDRCRNNFEHDDGVGYDHFLQTSEPIRNSRILAQQLINETQRMKNQRKSILQ